MTFEPQNIKWLNKAPSFIPLPFLNFTKYVKNSKKKSYINTWMFSHLIQNYHIHFACKFCWRSYSTFKAAWLLKMGLRKKTEIPEFSLEQKKSINWIQFFFGINAPYYSFIKSLQTSLHRSGVWQYWRTGLAEKQKTKM